MKMKFKLIICGVLSLLLMGCGTTTKQTTGDDGGIDSIPNATINGDWDWSETVTESNQHFVELPQTYTDSMTIIGSTGNYTLLWSDMSCGATETFNTTVTYEEPTLNVQYVKKSWYIISRASTDNYSFVINSDRSIGIGIYNGMARINGVDYWAKGTCRITRK